MNEKGEEKEEIGTEEGLLEDLDSPEIEHFLFENPELADLVLPKLEPVGRDSLYGDKLANLVLPELKPVGRENEAGGDKKTDIDKAKYINMINDIENGKSFLTGDKKLADLDLPELEPVGRENEAGGDKKEDGLETEESLNFPEKEVMGDNFLTGNPQMADLELPKLRRVGEKFTDSHAEVPIIKRRVINITVDSLKGISPEVLVKFYPYIKAFEKMARNDIRGFAQENDKDGDKGLPEENKDADEYMQ